MVSIEMTINEHPNKWGLTSGEIRNKHWVVRSNADDIMRLYKIIMRAQRLRKCNLGCLNFTKEKGALISELEIARVASWSGRVRRWPGKDLLAIGKTNKSEWIWYIKLPKPSEIKRLK